MAKPALATSAADKRLLVRQAARDIKAYFDFQLEDVYRLRFCQQYYPGEMPETVWMRIGSFLRDPRTARRWKNRELRRSASQTSSLLSEQQVHRPSLDVILKYVAAAGLESFDAGNGTDIANQATANTLMAIRKSLVTTGTREITPGDVHLLRFYSQRLTTVKPDDMAYVCKAYAVADLRSTYMRLKNTADVVGRIRLVVGQWGAAWDVLIDALRDYVWLYMADQ